MRNLFKFTKLMKGEPKKVRSKQNSAWIIDESKCISFHEVKQLRKYAGKLRDKGLKKIKFNWVRDWFMVELGLQAGLRVNEMATLQHKALLIDKSKSSIVVLGKGGKIRPVWIGTKFRQICHLFLGYKRQFGYQTDPQSYLLNNLSGTKISKRALQKVFKRILSEAGLPDHYTNHSMRHTYATFLLRASNNNYRFVQQQLGHASIRTTQVYATVLESEGRKALERIYG